MIRVTPIGDYSKAHRHDMIIYFMYETTVRMVIHFCLVVNKIDQPNLFS